MALGYAPFLLQHLKVVAADNAPETKVTPTGVLKMLMENNPQIQLPEWQKLQLTNDMGNIRAVTLKYLKRRSPSDTSEVDSCDNNSLPAYSEMSIQAPYFVSDSFFIPVSDVLKYEADAAKTVALGAPPTDFMQEHLTTLFTYVNGIVGAIDKKLIKNIVFGKNIVTGSAAATTLNIPLTSTNNDLTQGLGKLLADIEANEFSGKAMLAGGGKFNALMKQKGFTSFNQAGINNSSALDLFSWYYDNYANAASNAFGADNIGVFSKGSIGFVDYQKYIGAFPYKLGNSMFFQIKLPVMSAQNDGTVDYMTFDAQLKGYDCPIELPGAYSNTTVNRGYQLIISKNYGLFQIPADAYSAGDILTGNNGALLYNITNS